MKILLQSYNTFKQNQAGGVQTRINNLYTSLRRYSVDVKLFDKWDVKLENYDLIHFFKLSLDHYNLMMYAKDKHKPMILSSIVPIAEYWKIKAHLSLCNIVPLHTVFSLNKKMLDLVDVIIAQTQKEKEFIVMAYQIRSDKILVIPNGVSPYVLNGDPELVKSRFNITKECVLQVGRIDSNKNQLTTIRAMKNSDIPVVFIGGADPADPEYYHQCKKEASKNMYFLGWINQDDSLLSSAYALAKVVVLPSHKEIFGNALIEGAAAGANIIASNVLPIAEWGLNDLCKTINPNDVQALFSLVQELYNSDRNPMLSNVVETKFSWDSVAKEHLNIYNKLCL